MDDDPQRLLEEPVSTELRAMRSSINALKRELGSDRVVELLESEIADGGQRFEELVEEADGEWTAAQVEGTVDGPSWEQFFQGWELATERFSHFAMWFGAPELYAIDMTGPMEEQYAVERVGIEDDAVVRLNFAEADLSTLPFDPNPDFDEEQVLAVEQRNAEGTTTSYAVHQFRNTETGYEVRHSFLMPATVPDGYLETMERQLVIEFTNFPHVFVNTLNESEESDGDVTISDVQYRLPNEGALSTEEIEAMELESACRAHRILTGKLC